MKTLKTEEKEKKRNGRTMNGYKLKRKNEKEIQDDEKRRNRVKYANNSFKIRQNETKRK